MATAVEKLNILVIQHFEHVGVGDDVIAPVKAALETAKKDAKGSTLYELFCSATGEGGAPPPPQKQQVQQGQRTQQQQQRQAQQQQPMQGGAAMQQQHQKRASAQMGGSVAYNAQQAAMMQQQLVPETKPVIAKEPETRNPKLDDQLMAAAKGGLVDSIPGLVNSGAYVNMQDASGRTPLLAATEADKVDVVKVLLQNGADVNLATKDGVSPLLCAYKGNKKKVLKELTAGAFRTLNTAVHQHGNIGGHFMYDPGEDEGVTATDMVQLRDEVGSLFKLQAHPEAPPISPAKERKESLVNLDGPAEISDLRTGGVRLLMQELCHVGNKTAP